MARYKIDCCAKDCPDRKGDCHAKCERYLKQQEEYQATKAEHRKKRAGANSVYEGRCDSVHKATKRDRYRAKYR